MSISATASIVFGFSVPASDALRLNERAYAALVRGGFDRVSRACALRDLCEREGVAEIEALGYARIPRGTVVGVEVFKAESLSLFDPSALVVTDAQREAVERVARLLGVSTSLGWHLVPSIALW